MKAGDCFFGTFRVKAIPHYWLVLEDTDAAGNVAIVNFTTPQINLPKIHIVKKAFFNTLDYDSEVAWGFANVRSAKDIQACIAGKAFRSETAMPVNDLKAVIMEGDRRKLIPKEIRKRLLG